jgi:hypothetical protein
LGRGFGADAVGAQLLRQDVERHLEVVPNDGEILRELFLNPAEPRASQPRRRLRRRESWRDHRWDEWDRWDRGTKVRRSSNSALSL